MYEKSEQVGLEENGSMGRLGWLSMGVGKEETELDVEKDTGVEVDAEIGIGGYGTLSEIVGVPSERVEREVCAVILDVRLEPRRESKSNSVKVGVLPSGEGLEDVLLREMKLKRRSRFRVLVGDDGVSGTGVRAPEGRLEGRGPVESIDQRELSSRSADSSKSGTVGNACERGIDW